MCGIVCRHSGRRSPCRKTQGRCERERPRSCVRINEETDVDGSESSSSSVVTRNSSSTVTQHHLHRAQTQSRPQIISKSQHAPSLLSLRVQESVIIKNDRGKQSCSVCWCVCTLCARAGKIWCRAHNSPPIVVNRLRAGSSIIGASLRGRVWATSTRIHQSAKHARQTQGLLTLHDASLL